MIDFGMSADLNNAKYGISRNRRYKFGTGKYRPLEAFLGSLDLTQAYDMWSVGIMLLELALDDTLFGGLGKQNHYIIPVLMSLYFRESGQSGFPTDANFLSIESMPGYFGAQQLYDRLVKEETANEFERRQLTRYFADNLVKQARDTLDPEFYDLIMKLLRLDPSKRLKASEALNHRYFDDLKAIIAIH